MIGSAGGYSTLQLDIQMLEKKKNNEGGESATSIEKAETIQEIAVKLVEEQLQLLPTANGGGSGITTKESTIFMLGSKGVGKSTVLNKFFDRDEHTRPTLALEYSYGRRSGHTSANAPLYSQQQPQQQFPQKQVLNVWELGSMENAEQLIEVPLRTHGIENFAVILILDLAQPQRVWLDLECAHRGLQRACSNVLSAEALQRSRDRLANQRLKRAQQDHAGVTAAADMQELMPFPVVIVGGKYDVFMNFDPELKKHICRCLRSMTVRIGGALLFYSNKLPKLAKMLRDTISHFGFGSPAHPFRQHTTDYNEALTIWFGHDNWQQIHTNGNEMGLTVEQIGTMLAMEVPQLHATTYAKDNDNSKLVDPAKDQGFRECVIDDMRAQMDEQLLSIVRDAQLRAQFEAVTDD